MGPMNFWGNLAIAMASGCLPPGQRFLRLQMEHLGERIQAIPSKPDSCATCPLCRGAVTRWVVIDEARLYLNSKKRYCEERECSYTGNYDELRAHAKENHPGARPSEVDPARWLDWENFQQSSEITLMSCAQYIHKYHTVWCLETTLLVMSLEMSTRTFPAAKGIGGPLVFCFRSLIISGGLPEVGGDREQVSSGEVNRDQPMTHQMGMRVLFHLQILGSTDLTLVMMILQVQTIMTVVVAAAAAAAAEALVIAATGGAGLGTITPSRL